MNLKLFSYSFIMFFIFKTYLCFGLDSEKISTNAGCDLQDYLLTFSEREDDRLQKDMLNLDTLNDEFGLRRGYALTVIGFIKLDTSSTELNILIDSVKIYGGRPEGFKYKGIELYFKNQFEEYIYALTEEFGLNTDSFKNNCSFIILRRKYRNCG